MTLNTCLAASQNGIAHAQAVYRLSKISTPLRPSEHNELMICPASILSANLKRQVELVLIPSDSLHQSAR